MAETEVDGFEPLHHPPLRERVRDRLEQLIIEGVYPPGDHLVETDLAKRLGVSRGPIREALHLLQSQGWVDLRPRQGAFVHSPSPEEVDQFFQVRALIETEAAALAAGKMTEEIHTAMREAIREAREATATGDETTLIRSNAKFHGYVYRLAGNKVLEELMHSLEKRIRWYFSPVAMERAVDAWNEHEELLEALSAGDAERAVDVLRQHSRTTRDRYLQHRGTEPEAVDSQPASVPANGSGVLNGPPAAPTVARWA